MLKLPIDNLLDKLDKVTAKKYIKGGLNQWQALCPAHDDKSPSLTITEIEDGTVLLKCWAGCSANEIVSSIGLGLKDLFPRTEHTYKPSKLKPSKRAIAHEQLIITIAEATLSKGQALTNTDKERYQQAKQRLNLLNTEVR